MSTKIAKLGFAYYSIFIIIVAAGLLGFYKYRKNRVNLINSDQSIYTTPSITSNDEKQQDISAALSILKEISEIRYVENKVSEAGRKVFYTPEDQDGNVVTISLRESFLDDPHTSRIDTFKVDIESKRIVVEDIISGKDVALEEWKRTVKERFP